MNLPYENATSGAKALDEIGNVLTSFGCARFGTMTDNDEVPNSERRPRRRARGGGPDPDLRGGDPGGRPGRDNLKGKYEQAY